MKILSIFFACLLFSGLCFAQKPAVDTASFRGWPSLNRIGLTMSNDGKYALYAIRNRPVGGNTLVLQSTDAKWKYEVTNAVFSFSYNAVFTSDGKSVIFQKANDTLAILRLGDTTIRYLRNVASYRLEAISQCEWLITRSKTGNALHLEDLRTSTHFDMSGVNEYELSKEGNVIVFAAVEQTDSLHHVYLMNLASGEKRQIWTGTFPSNFVFDKSGSMLAFISTGRSNGSNLKTAWVYSVVPDKVTAVFSDDLERAPDSLHLSGLVRFTDTREKLIVDLSASNYLKRASIEPKADTWAYNDLNLPSSQFNYLKQTVFKATITISTGTLQRLEKDNQRLLIANEWNDESMLLIRQVTDREFLVQQDTTLRKTYFILSVNRGVTKEIRELRGFKGRVDISPGAKYLTWYDYVNKSINSYEIETGIIRNITKGLDIDWTIDSDRPMQTWNSNAVTAWTVRDLYVFLSDHHDIWLVDPLAIKHPQNITNYYGTTHPITFRIEGIPPFSNSAIIREPELFLSAFNQTNKQNGFYRKRLGQPGDPVLLTMGNWLYDVWAEGQNLTNDYNFPPVKALDANVYVVRRMSASEAPNYYATRDFKTFTQLSTLSPETHYNWIQSELHSWKSLDGKICQGILYKPANLDAGRKYPLLFYYYERYSQLLNAFPQPEYSWGGLQPNIAWYVSNGYLVFCPDIKYQQGATGQSAYNSIIGATHYLSKLPYVDTQKMGLQGHSFGGFETNYIVTHSKLFAAACSASGASDLVSFYNTADGAKDEHEYFENLQGRMGATLWQTPENYIRNSPVFAANQTAAPVLLMNNRNDRNVPFTQGAEFFMALRRLNKPAWLLSYGTGGHSLDKTLDAQDFTVRMRQFFDHYLKDAPAPYWMTKASNRATAGTITNDLDYDAAGYCSKDCAICRIWNECWKKDREAALNKMASFKKM